MILEITDRQLEIIEAAGRILTSSGVGGLTIKNLAKEMKFSESAIYRHFTSKEEIIIYMLRYLAESMDDRLSQSIQQSDGPEEKFKQLFKNQFAFFHSHPHFVVAAFSDGLTEQSQSINEAIIEIMKVKIKHLMPIMKEGQQKGLFTNAISTKELIHVVIGAFRLHMFKWKTAIFQFDLKRSGDDLIKSLLTLIKTK